MWKDEFEVVLKISFGMRIGGGSALAGSHLPVAREILEDSHYKTASINIVSSFRGVLRKSIRRVLSSIPQLNQKGAVERSLFGGWIEDSPSEGKIIVSFVDLGKHVVSERIGITVSDIFGSVISGRLFSYEFLEPLNDDYIQLRFKITPVLPLNEVEGAVLLAGLRSLKYDSLGGFGSRGLGLITEIRLDPKFEEVFSEKLRDLLGS